MKDFRSLGRRALVLSLGTLLFGAAIAGMAIWNLKPAPPPRPLPVTRTVINLPPGQQLAGLDGGPAVALSPDGTHLAYVASQGGIQQLYLRAMDSLDAEPIPGTDGAIEPFFSPDGQWVGFFEGGTIKKVSVSGGAALSLGDAANPRGASWGSQGTIVFAPQYVRVLQQLSDAGGTPQPLTRLEKGEFGHYWPDFLPDGKAVLFSTTMGATNTQVVVQSATGEQRKLVEGGTNPRYAPTGHLLYAQAGTLMALPFDPERLEVNGTAVPVAENVLQAAISGAAQYGVSDVGIAGLRFGRPSVDPINIGMGQPQWGRASLGRPCARLPIPAAFP